LKFLPGKLFRCLQIIFCLIVICSMLACSSQPKLSFSYENDKALQSVLSKPVPYPAASFAVFSDPHIFDSALGTSGKAFEEYITADRKLVREAPEILDSAIASMKNESVSFILIAGDLTKDGEQASHVMTANYLKQLKDAGKKVYVVPGNHDIKNGHSYKYVGDGKERVASVTAAQFADIYADYGYRDALYRDKVSLSYVAEPVAGLWLLGLDDCRYDENIEDKESITDGKFKPDTLKWIEEMLAKAARENKSVIGMLHHGIVEHYIGQEKNYGEYIVDGAPDVNRMLAAYNVRMVFTGHYHAQDITVTSYADTKKFVFDVETGSLVTYPCPYRVISISTNQQAAVSEKVVSVIKSHPQDFPQYARKYLEDGIAGIATKTLMGYKLDRPEAEMLAKQIAPAFTAHYSGDEIIKPGQQIIQENGLSPLGWLVIQYRKDLIIGLWNDRPPQDNNVTLDLATGTWK
jgi:3',5'-cyclic AMP phosphodiesterase CpdA